MQNTNNNSFLPKLGSLFISIELIILLHHGKKSFLYIIFRLSIGKYFFLPNDE